jgi:phosphatidylserine/phosphatidylglycerophosphate/cardiolipin synthase-like enzyme
VAAELHDWFLTADERGNQDTEIDRRRDDGRAWTDGNAVEALIHGATYFQRLHRELSALREGDWVHFTDWRGDADERLAGEGTELGTVLADLARRGVHVRGLVWRSHPDQARLSEQEAVRLADVVNEAGGEVLLDERVRRAGSHHQKLVLIRHPDDEDRDVAFVGGIDLCHGRNDDIRHLGDPQTVELDPRYGPRPPWHDVQLEVRGPAIGDLATTFRERWEDPTPLDARTPWRRRLARRAHEPTHPDPLPPMRRDPGPAGPVDVQVLRTYPSKRPALPYAPNGERSVARAYRKALGRARRLIYLEDQYLWSEHVADVIVEALHQSPDLRLIAVVPRYPEADGRLSGPPSRLGHQTALDRVTAVGGERVAVFDLENEAGTPVYVHAKVCVVDDIWCSIGSDNFNLRSWTHDSELSCGVLDGTLDGRAPEDPGGTGDGARRFARDLRLTLWAEHLGTTADDPRLLDADEGLALWHETAAALTRWHEGGDRGPRPPGRIGPHRPGRVRWWAAWWAAPIYRLGVDPDGRPAGLRSSKRF